MRTSRDLLFCHETRARPLFVLILRLNRFDRNLESVTYVTILVCILRDNSQWFLCTVGFFKFHPRTLGLAPRA
jgi:hypothetical protein